MEGWNQGGLKQKAGLGRVVKRLVRSWQAYIIQWLGGEHAFRASQSLSAWGAWCRNYGEGSLCLVSVCRGCGGAREGSGVDGVGLCLCSGGVGIGNQ